jgi:hypothetical protein
MPRKGTSAASIFRSSSRRLPRLELPSYGALLRQNQQRVDPRLQMPAEPTFTTDDMQVLRARCSVDDADAVLKALPWEERGGLRPDLRAAEQHRVRHVVASVGREVLLKGHLGTADRFQERPDQLLLGVGLRRIAKAA